MNPHVHWLNVHHVLLATFASHENNAGFQQRIAILGSFFSGGT
jgi:hypothetical protein